MNKRGLQSKLRCRRGMTLLEVVLSCAMLSILSLAIAGLLQPSLALYTESTNLSRGKRIAQDVSDLLLSELLYAKALVIDEQWEEGALTGQGKNASFTSPSYGSMRLEQLNDVIRFYRVEFEGELGYGPEHYMGNTAQAGLTIDNENKALTLQVLVYNNRNQQIADKTITVKLLNHDIRADP